MQDMRGAFDPQLKLSFIREIIKVLNLDIPYIKPC